MLATGSFILTLAADASANDGNWVHLFPVGEINARDGRAWRIQDPTAVVAATRQRAGSLPLAIDYEHQVERSEKNGQPAPAAGWITDLEARPDGIWGRVEWTERAAEFIAKREYRFLSPSFLTTKAGDVTAIIGAGLTNRPALELTAIAKDTPSMDPELEAAIASLRNIFNLPASAPADAIVEAARSCVAGATASADPTRYVPIETFEQAVAELNRVSQGVSHEAAVIAVDREIATGRLVPSMRDWGVSLCRENKPAFDGFIERTAGGLKHLFTSSAERRKPPPTNGDGDLDAEIARNLGLSAD